MKTRQELDSVLHELKRVQDIEACAFVSRDGLMISACLLDTSDYEAFAAYAATMFNAAQMALREIDKNVSARVICESGRCRLIVISAANGYLAAMTVPGAGLGHVLAGMEKAAGKIG